MSEAVPPGFDLEQFRGYLLFLTQLVWDTRLQSDCQPDDLVQQTLQEALAAQKQFRGTTEAELKAWLRRIHNRNLLDAFKKKPARSLEELLEESSSRIDAFLAANQSSPSERAAKNEQLTRLADSLAKLSPLQREAVVLHHLQGLTIAETARRMGRPEASAAGLIRRGLKELKKLMG
jgi:RNA polymerase sigma-70 factor, ECF subfamily